MHGSARAENTMMSSTSIGCSVTQRTDEDPYSLDSGDHGHPNDVGYAAFANAIDLRLFRNGEGQH